MHGKRKRRVIVSERIFSVVSLGSEALRLQFIDWFIQTKILLLSPTEFPKSGITHCYEWLHLLRTFEVKVSCTGKRKHQKLSTSNSAHDQRAYRSHVKSFPAMHQNSVPLPWHFSCDQPPSSEGPFIHSRTFYLPARFHSSCHSFLNVCKFHLFSLMEENCFLSLQQKHLKPSSYWWRWYCCYIAATDELCRLCSPHPRRTSSSLT